MKFGKKLRATVDNSYEEWRPMFMSYKDLKKCIHPRRPDDAQSKDSDTKDPDQDADSDPDRTAFSVPVSYADKKRNVDAVRHAEAAHSQFFSTFRHEVDKVNEFFLDKQEDYIIEHRQLSEKAVEFLVPGRATRPELNRLRQRLTNFHGELVLLENFSTVNYTGFRKILKKHDKKTGTNMRNIYLKTVLITPFFLSDTVRNLILKTEAQLASLDTIHKFRRASPTSALTLDGPGPHATNLPTTPSGSKHASSAASPVALPLAPAALSPCTQIVMEPPRPCAFISPRSALWRLYSEARAFGDTMHDMLSTSSSISSVTTPPQSLIDLVDAVSATELGLEPPFLNAVTQPSNYCIAGDETFSMGFFVVRPKTKLQIFKSHHGGAFISKNMRGRARLHVYETTTNGSATKVPYEYDSVAEAAEERHDFCVEQKRGGVTFGPWPAVACHSQDMHVEWVPETLCAIFYVCTPSLKDNNDRMPRYEIHPLTPPRFRVLYDPEDVLRFIRVTC